MLTDTDLATIDPPAAAAIVTYRAERDSAHAYPRRPCSGHVRAAPGIAERTLSFARHENTP